MHSISEMKKIKLKIEIENELNVKRKEKKKLKKQISKRFKKLLKVTQLIVSHSLHSGFPASNLIFILL